jgi:hypothetical protein
MVDLQPVDRVQFKRHQHPAWTEAGMAQEPEDPNEAADRLEAALERIAHHAPARPPVGAYAPDTNLPDTNLSVPEIAERLDSLIGRLRVALGKNE